MRYHIWLKEAYTGEEYDIYVNAEDEERAKEYAQKDTSDEILDISEDVKSPMYYNHTGFAEFIRSY